MARARRRRWKGWRVEESGRGIRSNPDNDKTERDSRKRKRARQEAKRSERWWWTLTGRDSNCDGCLRDLRKGQKMAFRVEPKRVLCPDCARREGVHGKCKKSKKLKASEAKRAAKKR